MAKNYQIKNCENEDHPRSTSSLLVKKTILLCGSGDSTGVMP